MQGEGVHVEFTMTGISREMLRSVLEWMWELIQPAFPIITGAWGLEQTLYFATAVVGLSLAERLIRHLAEGKNSGKRTLAGVGGATGGLSAHSREAVRTDVLSARPHSGASAPTITTGYSKAAALVLILGHRSLGFISRMGVNYLLLSLLVCVFFGTGDLQLLEVLFGIGGRG